MGEDIETLVRCCKSEPDSVVLRRNDVNTPRSFRIHLQLWWGAFHMEGWGDTVSAAWQQFDARVMHGFGSEFIDLDAYKAARAAGKFCELSILGLTTGAQL